MFPKALLYLLATLLSLSSAVAQNNPTYSVYLPVMVQPVHVQPDRISVKSYTTYLRGADRYLVGELINTTSQTVADVAVHVQFTYASGIKILKSTNAYIRVLPPQQTVPFKLMVPNAPEPLVSTEVSFAYGCCNGGQYPLRHSITITTTNLHDEYGVSVNGAYRNDHAFTIYDPVFVATFYNEAGQVIGVEANERAPVMLVDAPILSGQSGLFEIETSLLRSQFLTYTVQAEGYAYP